MARNNNLRLLISDEERRMVRALAKKRGLTMADVIRQLIRHAYDQRDPADVNGKK